VKPATKSARHAKPTPYQLADRTYRNELAHYADLVNQLALVRLDLAAIREHVPKLADHCQRLMREKEILQGENDTLKGIMLKRDELDAANAFMAAPLPVPRQQSEIPTLRVADIANAGPEPSNALASHDFGEYVPMRCCRRCKKLRLALLESGEGCIEAVGSAA
jgi:hypothetical protein